MKMAAKKEVTEVLHGVEVSDPYRWLEGDPNSPEIHAWLCEEARIASEYFKTTQSRSTLSDEFKRLSNVDTIPLLQLKGGKYFFSKRKAAEDMAVVYVQDSLDSTPKVLIDPNAFLGERKAILSGWHPSRDAKLLAYGLSKSGNDKRELRVLNVETREDLEESIPDDVYPYFACWNSDSTGFWYAKRSPDAPLEEAKFHKRLYFHKIGTDSSKDELVWGANFERETRPQAVLSADARYLLLDSEGQESGKIWTEIFVQDLEDTSGEPIPVVRKSPGSFCTGSIHRDTLYVLTNQDAPRGKIISTTIESALAGKPEFTELIAESDNIIESFTLIQDKLYVSVMRDVRSILYEYSLKGKLIREIPLPTVGTINGLVRESEGSELFIYFESFAFPPAILRVDMLTGEIFLYQQMESVFDGEQIITEQAWCDSKDGTRIPLFLVYKKGLTKNGKNPTMLYGYGGFSISKRPLYTTAIIPFIERGGIYVVSTLRGGGEYGKGWYEAGTKSQKQNTFDDFIAAAEYLVRENYTSNEKLGIMGASNGGLLVSALMTQRPELVRAVVCRVPVADMLRYHLHHGGRHWIPDYGNPDDADMFVYLHGYSPYHNVRDGVEYPATLIMTSDGDDRVHPLHAYKLAARLQEANASKYPILMRVEINAGHGGAQAVSSAIEQEADLWSFVFDQLGVSK